MSNHRERRDPLEAEDLLHGLSNDEWRAAHDVQFGKGSTIPDEELSYIWRPGAGASDLTPEEIAKKLSKGGFVVDAKDVNK